MIEVAEVIKLIGNTNSSNDKLYLLKKNEHVPGLKEILRFIYNPYTRTGISKAKLAKAMKMNIDNGSVRVLWSEAISYFSKCQTGNDADLAFAARFIATNQEAEWLAKAIVTQDLKIGITATSLNKVYGADFIPKIGCMLGTLYGDVGPEKPSGLALLQKSLMVFVAYWLRRMVCVDAIVVQDTKILALLKL